MRNAQTGPGPAHATSAPDRTSGGVNRAALTPREVDVLRVIGDGSTNRQIARTLNISEKTVKNHLRIIYEKTGAADRTQAALYAFRLGLRACQPCRRVPRSNGDPDLLTTREVEILRLVAQGLTNRQISRRLKISEKTVKNHLSAIYSKTGAAGRTQAALHALYTGLVRIGMGMVAAVDAAA
jgi:DNA-binding NarL/FixJ family response regulator